MTEAPVVTVLIPARNEENDIERCLHAVVAQDHPHDRMEIVVIDGGSTDGTAVLARRVLADVDVPWSIVANAAGTTPSNLNAGLAVASGDIVCRVDARSVVPVDYVRRCAEVLTANPCFRVTGGAQVAVARDRTARSIGIARALNNHFMMGGARYRSAATSGPAETVYLGAFRTDELRAAGGWDERMLTNQDFELNRRMSSEGTVWFDARLAVGYLPRPTVLGLCRQYHRFGRWKVRYWRITGDRPLPRQWAVVLTPPVAAGAAALFVLGSRHGRRRRAVLAGTAGVCGLFTLEELGGTEPAPVGVRFVAAAAGVAVGAGFLSGVVRELVAG